MGQAALTFDDLLPGQPAQGEAQPPPAAYAELTPEQMAFVRDASAKRPDLSPEQLAYAAKAAPGRDPSAGEGSTANPSYDRPGLEGAAELAHVTHAGQLAAPATGEGGVYFDDLVPKVSAGEDAWRSAGGGLMRGAAGAVDFIGGALPGLNVLERMTSGAMVPGTFDLAHPTGHFVEKLGGALAPKEMGYEPQTKAGQYLHTIGEFAPIAAMGGEGIGARVANALLPAIASQASGDAAHEMGASPGVERATRLAGAVLGGGAASVRLNPAALTRGEENATTLSSLEAQKNAAYRAVDEAGISFKPAAFSDLTQKMATAMDEAGFSAGLHPKASTMIANIGSSVRGAKGHAPTLSELDKLRQQIGRDVASTSEAGERRMGTIMRQAIDDFIAGAKPEDLHVGAGDPGKAADLLNRARDLNTRVEKLKTLENLDDAAIDRAAATGNGTNGQNTSRQNAIRFQKQVGNLTSDEQAAARTAIRGTLAQNALRGLGALSPERGAIGSFVHLAAAFGSGGHSIPLSVASILARRASGAMQEANVQRLRDLISAGGDKAAVRTNALAPKRLIVTPDPLLDRSIPAAALSYQSESVARPRPR